MKNIKYEISISKHVLTRFAKIAELEGNSIDHTIVRALVLHVLRHKFIEQNNLHDDMFYGPVLRKREQEIEKEIRSLDA